jgi:hypothetical protein
MLAAGMIFWEMLAAKVYRGEVSLMKVRGVESKTMLKGLSEAEMDKFAATPWPEVEKSLTLVAYSVDVLERIQLKVAKEAAGD